MRNKKSIAVLLGDPSGIGPELISKILKKEYFNSGIIKKESQKYIFSEVKEIFSYKGNLEDSDICFIQKK